MKTFFHVSYRKNTQSRTEKKQGINHCGWQCPRVVLKKKHRRHLKWHLSSLSTGPSISLPQHSSNSCGLLDWVLNGAKELFLVSFLITDLNTDLMLLEKCWLPCSILGDISYQESGLLSLCYWKVTFISPPSCNHTWIFAHKFGVNGIFYNIIKEDKPKFIHLVK